MFILPLKSRQQILKERKNPEFIWTSKYLMMFITPTPEKNIGPNAKYRATDFVRLLLVVTKKIHKKAVVRNKLRRRIKEAFRQVNKELLSNKYDYQLIARQAIFKASVNDLIKDIESCLKGEAIPGITEKPKDKKRKNNKNSSNKIKTSDALKLSKKTNKV